MKRREFVEVAAVAAAGCALPAPFARSAGRVKHVSLELYSVRNEMRKDPEGTLAAVRAMGYDDVELLWSFGNFGRTNEQVKAALANTGLKASSAHIAPSLLTKDWQKSVDAAEYLGQQYLIVPSLTAEADKSLDEWKRWADLFNAAGAVARKGGIWLGFHNEPNHMKPIDGVVPFDLFIERTDPAAVRLQLDAGNMRMGGGDPMQYLMKHHDRFWSFHIKDVVADNTRDTDLGTGTVDFKALLGMVRDIDDKLCVVEQEGSAAPLESAKRNLQYMRALRF
ncbi:MAG TPA: sugar phosphate isomerase/epimerase [Gemmatimonadaceae bacterium]|jgi:sugar phosphate isomerase/epimerase